MKAKLVNTAALAACRCRVTRFVAVLALLGCMLSMPSYSQEAGGLDASGEKKILVVGDSLSAAYKLSQEDGWVALLQERLQSEGFPHHVINASVSGATTAGGMAVMKDSLAKHRPGWVLLELGANDGLQGKPVPYITRNLERLIEIAKNSGAQVILLGIRMPPNFGRRYTEPFFAQYKMLAEKFELPFVPFLLEGVAGVPDLMMEDGLHPRASAQPRVLDNVWPTLKAQISP